MDEQRLQRIEDKIDKLSDLAINTAILQQEMITLQKKQDKEAEEGKQRDKEVVDLSKRINTLEDRQKTILRVGVLALLAVIGYFTGINLL